MAALGEALQETTRILAKKYSLNRSEIDSWLQEIDTSLTDIDAFCPAVLRSTTYFCSEDSRYRNIDASCNNLHHPTRGTARFPFKRLIAPQYSDGISKPRQGWDDFPLPSARTVSFHAHRDVARDSHHGLAFMFAAWGQLVDHDLTLTAETKESGTRKDIQCCLGAEHPNCMPLQVPFNDPFYKHHNQHCINFLRSLAGVRENCKLGSRVQTNSLTSYIDANFVYGSSPALAAKLREHRGGCLKVLPLFKDLGLKPLLPLKTEQPDDGCIRPHRDLYCYLAGDNRVNEQLALGVLHTIFVREHNRIAHELSVVNPHWSDEQIYQESRHLLSAMVQHITYNEFLPRLLGKQTMQKYGLELKRYGYADEYDPYVDATIPAAFGTAAFRFGHSLLPKSMERWSVTHKFIASRRFSEMFQQPYDLNKPGWLDQYLVGMINQAALPMDDAITSQVTNHLFQEPTHDYGKDLASINLQRAREHGVPSYSEFREFCNLPPINTWSSLLKSLDNSTVIRYQDLYSFPQDIDLWSAGVSEIPIGDSLIGPTFSCIIARTFRDLKKGDRFWHENSASPTGFTLAQLQEIRKVKLSRVLCDNADDLITIQPWALEMPNDDTNSRVSCNSRLLEGINFDHWREKDPWGQQTLASSPDPWNPPQSLTSSPDPWVSSHSRPLSAHYKPTPPAQPKPNLQIEVSYSPQVSYTPLETSEKTEINVTSTYTPLESLFVHQISTKKPLTDKYGFYSSTHAPPSSVSTYTSVDISSPHSPSVQSDTSYSSHKPDVTVEPLSSTYATYTSYIPIKDTEHDVPSSSYTSINTISSTFSPNKHYMTSHKDNYSPHKDSYGSATHVSSHLEINRQPELDPYLLENVQFLVHAIAANKSAHIIQTDHRVQGYH
uniref:Peroxidasin homolog n=1 Tax=Cacopsylla melanoneura TaxID=428564 RepID=A0A8D8QM30_9HEMI